MRDSKKSRNLASRMSPFYIWGGILGTHTFIYFLATKVLFKNFFPHGNMKFFIPIGISISLLLACTGLIYLWRAKKEKELNKFMRFYLLALLFFEALSNFSVAAIMMGADHEFFYPNFLTGFCLHLVAFPYKYSPFYKA